jgi:hypothetical protein
MKATIAAGLVFITLFVSKVLPAAVIVDEGSGKEPQQEGTHSSQ